MLFEDLKLNNESQLKILNDCLPPGKRKQNKCRAANCYFHNRNCRTDWLFKFYFSNNFLSNNFEFKSNTDSIIHNMD